MDETELRRILRFIRGFTQEHGFPPSYAEIAESCGFRSVGHVQYRVNRLVREGRLVRSPGRARSLQIVPGPDRQPKQKGIEKLRRLLADKLGRLVARGNKRWPL